MPSDLIILLFLMPTSVDHQVPKLLLCWVDELIYADWDLLPRSCTLALVRLCFSNFIALADHSSKVKSNHLVPPQLQLCYSFVLQYSLLIRWLLKQRQS